MSWQRLGRNAARVGRRVARRATSHQADHDSTLARLDRQARRLDRLEKSARETGAQISRCERMLTEWTPMVGNVRTMLHVVEHQVGAIETRLADLSEQVTPTKPLDMLQQAEAVDVLAEVRAEHRQVRTRLKILTSYEERIRRLEAVARVTLDNAPYDIDVHGRRRVD